MARYIDADRLVKNIAAIGDMRKLSTKTVGIAIDETPTVDVVEVRHGRWMPVEYTYFGAKRYECSECRDDEFWKKRFVVHKENYCPNCGAKMDGKDEEDGTI